MICTAVNIGMIAPRSVSSGTCWRERCAGAQGSLGTVLKMSRDRYKVLVRVVWRVAIIDKGKRAVCLTKKREKYTQHPTVPCSV